MTKEEVQLPMRNLQQERGNPSHITMEGVENRYAISREVHKLIDMTNNFQSEYHAALMRKDFTLAFVIHERWFLLNLPIDERKKEVEGLRELEDFIKQDDESLPHWLLPEDVEDLTLLEESSSAKPLPADFYSARR